MAGSTCRDIPKGICNPMLLLVFPSRDNLFDLALAGHKAPELKDLNLIKLGPPDDTQNNSALAMPPPIATTDINTGARMSALEDALSQ